MEVKEEKEVKEEDEEEKEKKEKKEKRNVLDAIKEGVKKKLIDACGLCYGISILIK